MFTGIISGIGTVEKVTDGRGTERALVIETPYDDVALGESIAVNGTCLTAAELNGRTLTFYASQETLERTNLCRLVRGSRVNLERALRLSDRLSGHLVQGHVDGLGRLKSIRPEGESHEITVELAPDQLRYVVEKGSITLDGISLTVNRVEGRLASLMIIPHTWQHTTLSTKEVGQDFNVELDVVAKYVEKMLVYGKNH